MWNKGKRILFWEDLWIYRSMQENQLEGLKRPGTAVLKKIWNCLTPARRQHMIKWSGKDSLHVRPQWEEKDKMKMMMMMNCHLSKIFRPTESPAILLASPVRVATATCLSQLLISFMHFPLSEILGGLACNAVQHLVNHLLLTRKPKGTIATSHFGPSLSITTGQATGDVWHNFKLETPRKGLVRDLYLPDEGAWLFAPLKLHSGVLWCVCTIAHLKMQALLPGKTLGA